MLSHFRLVQLFETLWIAACQVPLWDSPGKNTEVGYHAPLQEVIPTWGFNPHLLHARWILYPLSHLGSPL